MRNITFIAIVTLFVFESCSCIPTNTEVKGKFQLESILNEQGIRQSQKDSLRFINFELEKINDINKTVETYSSNDQRYVWAMTENPDQCEKSATKRVFVTYQNGQKRRIIRDASDPMKVRLEMSEVYQGDEVPELPIYYYVVVTQ